MAGEAENAGFKSEEDVVSYIKNLRSNELVQCNLAKHGIDFEEAQNLQQGTYVVYPARSEFENRYALIGELNDSIYTCIYTLRRDKTRIISCRIARNGERILYENAINT